MVLRIGVDKTEHVSYKRRVAYNPKKIQLMDNLFNAQIPLSKLINISRIFAGKLLGLWASL